MVARWSSAASSGSLGERVSRPRQPHPRDNIRLKVHLGPTGNDADSLRHDPAFKLALGRLPNGAALCSQPTISRLENLPRPRDLLRIGQAMIGLYCDSIRQVPRRITLDIYPGSPRTPFVGWDDTSDAIHGGQQLRLFNA